MWEISWFCSLLTLWAGIGFVLSLGRLDIIHLFNICLKLTPKLANKVYSMQEVFTNISSYCFHPSEQEKRKTTNIWSCCVIGCFFMYLLAIVSHAREYKVYTPPYANLPFYLYTKYQMFSKLPWGIFAWSASFNFLINVWDIHIRFKSCWTYNKPKCSKNC